MNRKSNASALAGLRLAFDKADSVTADCACGIDDGVIAIGHPIGVFGCRISVTLLHEMRRRDAKKGITSLCIGGGMGVALTIER